MQFRYVAYTLEEGVVKGQVEAAAEIDARAEVRRLGLKLLRVSPVRKPPGLEELFPSLFRVGTGELTRFARNVAAMLTSGGSLLRVLEMLQSESRHRLMRRTLASIRETLDEGGSLTDALRKHPSVFDTLFISVVEVGEHTGRLGPALEQMADILEKEQEAKQKAIRTLMYPVAIIGLAVVTLVVLMLVAVPPLLEVFERMGTEIPLVTRLIVGLFKQVGDKFMAILITVAGLVVFVMLARRIPRVRYWMNVVQVHAPLLGALTVTGELARFSQTMAMLLEAGVPLATGLRLGITGCKNRVLRKAFTDAEESLLSGHGLASALKKHSVLPSLFVELMVIGEESNSLARTVRDAASSYRKQQDRRLDSLLGVLEPASTLIVGGVVGLIAFSMFVPIYSGLEAFE